jgi:tetrapyrrole methylase family protein/MazG family protein
LTSKETVHPFDELVKIMDRLRGENGCPWDKKQDHHSLLSYLLEETYEVIDAVHSGSMDGLCEELGDLLLQIVFQAHLAKEKGAFDAYKVIKTLNQKLIRRHPHVFGDKSLSTAQEVVESWEEIKRQEKGLEKLEQKSLMDEVPKYLPSLMYAYEVGKKAAKVGFDWNNSLDVLPKVIEEAKELIESYSSTDSKEQIKEEWGDLIFSLVNLARHLDIEPESAVRLASDKFEMRFRSLEKLAESRNKELSQMSLAEMDQLWDEIKQKGNKRN